VPSLSSRAWGLLKPFHRSYSRFLLGIAARQALIVAGGYSLVWLIHSSLNYRSVPIWVFIAGLLLYDLGLLRLDLLLNIFFVSRVSFPLYGFLRSKALGKILDLPSEWHHQQQSGALTGKVNEGVGKVVQTAEGLGRELFPALIQTALTLVPLIYLSPWSVAFVAPAVALFSLITWRESRARAPFRRARHENYARDFGMFSECVDYAQAIVHFGQSRRLLDQYGQLQREISTQVN
jgi:ABC-type multidrug transport system fused ATPase/permease subunit